MARKHTGMVLLDTEKAYDTIWLNGLLFKLISLHLPDYLLFFLKSYLEGRTFTVHLNDTTYTPKPTSSGLPQGAVRGVDKSLARPTSRFILFDGENISFDTYLLHGAESFLRS